ncbi:MAG: HNH endonuclease [Saccharofermentanales bacterium]
MCNINHNYIIYKKYSIEEIFENLNNNSLPDELLYHNKDRDDSLYRAKIIRELIKRDGLECKQCKKIPEYFALGKDKINRWHLDLYSDYKNDHYMYTIDHVYPKSKGGKNELSNYQLLCKKCNEIKGDKIDDNDDIKQEVKNHKNTKYISKKTESLSQQIKGILLKLKNHTLICIKKQNNFTLYTEYKITDIKVKIDNDFNTKYIVYINGDNGKLTKTTFDNFMTKIDYENYCK